MVPNDGGYGVRMASPAPERRWQVAAFHLPLFVGCALVWMIAINLVVAVWLLIDGQQVTDATDLLAWLGPVGMGGFTVVQMAGLALLAMSLSLFVSPGTPAAVTRPSHDVRDRLQRAFPLSIPLIWLLVAVLGGLTIWTFPSWIAQELLPLLPDYDSTNELLTRILRTAPPAGRAVVVFAIVVSAPLFEELIFRGYLWRVLEASFGPVVALIGTTLLFATFHLDPVQGVALLPIALFLGWLRWRSGSLVPSIVTHLMNNGLGIVVVFATSESSGDDELGIGVALGGLAATIAIGALGAWISRRGGSVDP